MNFAITGERSGDLNRLLREGANRHHPSTDRRKPGSKHHVISDANGTPLATILTGANRHDSTQLIPLVEAIPPIRGKVGAPLLKPKCVVGDRGYDSDEHRMTL